MSQGIKIRVFQRNDSEIVIELISDIIVNEFGFKLEFDTLDSDILAIEEIYNKSDGGCFWVAESIDDSNTQAILKETKAFEITFIER